MNGGKRTMLKPASMFTDGAVLCRRKEIRVFGEAADGEKVTARLTDRAGALLAEGEGTAAGGRFLVLLPPQEAQTGCRLEIRTAKECAAAEDVAVGDVYLAGGQSNMELALCNADEGPGIVESHNDPLIRFYNVPKTAVPGPEQKKAVEDARWHAALPGQGGGDSAVAWFFAEALRRKMPETPVGIIGCYWGGTSVSCWMEEEDLRTLAEGQRYLSEYAERCAGKTMETFLAEEKVFQEAFDRWNRQVEACKKENPGITWEEIEKALGPCPWNPPAGPGSPYRPCGLAVTMLREIVPAALTGILYYQGEDDTTRTRQYDRLMELLIRVWREKFRDPLLPFLFVQLPMWLDRGAEDTFLWPYLRQSQAKARDNTRNTGMVCLLDQGEYGNIHPTAKRPVGERLAELAGSMIYGGGEVSPRALDKYTEGGTMTIRLSQEVVTRDGQEARLLEAAGEDGRFVPARAEIRGDRLLLRAEGVERPVHARYAWTDWSDRVNLFGKNGLPLEPFVF